MGLRDIVLLVLIFGTIPLILRKPFFGVLVWYWLGLMNPHRLSWALAEVPFAQIVAIAMLGSLLVSQEPKRLPATGTVVLLAVFWFWMLVTTYFSFYPELAWWQWDKVWKIMLTTFVAMLVLNSRDRILAFTAVITGSLAVYGIKGGIFTVLTGGGYRVWGPPGSFIGGNNEIGLALIMVIPLLFFLSTLASSRLLRGSLIISMVLCFIAILGTQSRGAALGVAAMGSFLVLKSEKRGAFLLLAVLMVPVGLALMPESWYERMASISDYRQDGSAMGRLQAWEMSIYLALDRPLIGGGFEAFKPATYAIYTPWNIRTTDAHSIYFEILGEHGFLGLALFVGIGFSVFLNCRRIILMLRGRDDLAWAKRLAEMIQVCLVGYAASGAFLGLAYFDFYYAIVALSVSLGATIQRTLAEGQLRGSDGAVVGNAAAGPLSPVVDVPQALATKGNRVTALFGWLRHWWARI